MMIGTGFGFVEINASVTSGRVPYTDWHTLKLTSRELSPCCVLQNVSIELVFTLQIQVSWYISIPSISIAEEEFSMRIQNKFTVSNNKTLLNTFI